MDKEKIFRIGISGSYGGLNLGDEAILQSIITQLRTSVNSEITVFSRDPADTLNRHKVERVIPVRDLTMEEIKPEIKRLDLFILGGGGILYDGEAKVYLREVMIAHEMGIPVMVYAISAGPLTIRGIQKHVCESLEQAKIITVREKGARRLLEDIGLKKEIIVTADPAFLLTPEELPADTLVREHMDGSKHLICMSVREPGIAAPDINDEIYHEILANAADFMVDRYDANIIFIPMERKMLDLQHSHAVVSLMLRPQHAWILKGQYTSGQLLTLMKHFDLAVGMRLHFLLFAALQEVPFVALPYSSKVTGFLDDLKVSMPPLHLVNAGRLIAHIDKSWDNKDEIKDHIRDTIPDMKKRALWNNEILVNVLKEITK